MGAGLFVPIILDGEALAETGIIDDAAQKRGFSRSIARHVIGITCRKFDFQRLIGARNLGVLNQPVAEQ